MRILVPDAWHSWSPSMGTPYIDASLVPKEPSINPPKLTSGFEFSYYKIWNFAGIMFRNSS